MQIEAGRVLSERYRLIRPLGQGSQAAVWVADHLALQTHVAVKLIDPELAKREDARERFKREATAAAQLRSAHVVQILDHGIDGDQPFIVMELLDGEDLFERLNQRGRLTLRDTSKIVTQVARALNRAHQAGIVHRDLKPENVFLVPNDDDEVVKVLDFGVAKVSDPAKQTMRKTGVGTLVGTPHYMSPEQVKGIGEVDARSDLWALGVIAFQCVTGELPFDSEGVGDLLIKISIGDIPVPSNFVKTLPAAFDKWFLKACAREVDKRFQSAKELALELAALAGPDTAKKPSMRPPPAAPPRPGKDERGSSPFLDEDEFEEVLDTKQRPTAAPEEPRPSSSGRSGSPSSKKPRPPLRSRASDDVDVDVPSQPPPPPSSRPSQAIPLVVKSAEQPTSASRPPLMPLSPDAPASRRSGTTTPPISTVDGLARSRNFRTDPPPELDGSKRRRIVTWFFALFALAAAAIAFSVYRSQLRAAPQPAAEPAAPPGPAPIEPPVVLTGMPVLTAADTTSAPVEAVDPGKLKHPVATSTAPARVRGPLRKKKKASDATVEIPDPPADDGE
ncbi:MAG TPA: serine/threonine-protein kinase [Minicystis sp.]|nr:serine/threonine-protein kinase [Minicystis sp.]